jgi:hypothetical protein
MARAVLGGTICAPPSVAPLAPASTPPPAGGPSPGSWSLEQPAGTPSNTVKIETTFNASLMLSPRSPSQVS